MDKFDPTKPVQTRDGRKVRIVCTDRMHQRSVVALVTEGDNETPYNYYHDGKMYVIGSSTYDLVNIPPEPVVTQTFNNIYPRGGLGITSYDRDVCRKMQSPNCIGVLIRTFHDDVFHSVEFERTKE